MLSLLQGFPTFLHSEYQSYQNRKLKNKRIIFPCSQMHSLIDLGQMENPGKGVYKKLGAYKG